MSSEHRKQTNVTLFCLMSALHYIFYRLIAIFCQIHPYFFSGLVYAPDLMCASAVQGLEPRTAA